ncbi:hypothetical protein KM043_003681 [Ampulex compressa]|nr:hypothetical protein KM043_003681 [Ampulex compressa]
MDEAELDEERKLEVKEERGCYEKEREIAWEERGENKERQSSTCARRCEREKKGEAKNIREERAARGRRRVDTRGEEIRGQRKPAKTEGRKGKKNGSQGRERKTAEFGVCYAVQAGEKGRYEDERSAKNKIPRLDTREDRGRWYEPAEREGGEEEGRERRTEDTEEESGSVARGAKRGEERRREAGWRERGIERRSKARRGGEGEAEEEEGGREGKLASEVARVRREEAEASGKWRIARVQRLAGVRERA